MLCLVTHKMSANSGVPSASFSVSGSRFAHTTRSSSELSVRPSDTRIPRFSAQLSVWRAAQARPGAAARRRPGSGPARQCSACAASGAAAPAAARPPRVRRLRTRTEGHCAEQPRQHRPSTRYQNHPRRRARQRACVAAPQWAKFRSAKPSGRQNSRPTARVHANSARRPSRGNTQSASQPIAQLRSPPVFVARQQACFVESHVLGMDRSGGSALPRHKARCSKEAQPEAAAEGRSRKPTASGASGRAPWRGEGAKEAR